MKDKKPGIRKHEKGNPYEKENRVDAKLIEMDRKVTTIYRILDWYKEGLFRASIVEMLRAEEFSDSVIDEYLTECSSIIYEQFSTKSSNIVSLHLKRYDKEINTLLKRNYDRLPLKIRYKVKGAAFLNALETLHQKEKLLNLHNKQTLIRFNQRNNINETPEKPNRFDLTQLTLEERIDLLNLISKASPKNNINSGVILREKVIESEETVDIQHEEVINITQIQQENVMGVDVFPEQKAHTVDELTKKLQDTLKKKAEEALIKAGSKTVEHERKL